MAYYPKKEIEEVKRLDLYNYLNNYKPEELVQYNRDTYTTKTHDSLKISNGMWYWFSRGIGGKSALEYLIKVKEYSFTEAMDTIQRCLKEQPLVYSKLETTNKKIKDLKLILPEKNSNNNKVIRYLVSRGIDEYIVRELIDKELIYESKDNHNVVFVSYDQNKIARYAFIRATNDTRFMQEAYGSHKAFSFKLDSSGNKETLHVFESAIDLLSYATLLKKYNKKWYEENYLSLAGVYQPSEKNDKKNIPIAIKYYLNQHQNIRKIYLHLDNDKAGRIATISLKNSLENRFQVIDSPPKSGKDFNDFLCEINKKKQFNINNKER